MNRSKWYLHPILIFVFSILALGLSLFLYIYWYMQVSTGLEAVVMKFNLDRGQILESRTWVVIMVLSILVGIILAGILVIFVYSQKTLQLYRLQRNFINNFTHELKTPVTSLKLYLETFNKYELSREDQLKYIDYMISDVERLSENINSIMNHARIESKSYEGEFVKLELVDFFRQFFLKNKHLFTKCNIKINNLNNFVYYYPVNESLLETLLMNITTNAIKYNDSGSPELNITFNSQKSNLHICFEDNGIGIAKKELKKIFKKFYQVGRSDNMSAKGSGLGLYLVDTIVRIHKGKIKSVSRGIGKGSVFTVILPVSPGLGY